MTKQNRSEIKAPNTRRSTAISWIIWFEKLFSSKPKENKGKYCFSLKNGDNLIIENPEKKYVQGKAGSGKEIENKFNGKINTD